ncbi:MAG: hypothetical protein JJU02_02740 [Cryomorphaceae bacterium]|nr:hypothetical protein [Cryomorphaceae bacterium]
MKKKFIDMKEVNRQIDKGLKDDLPRQKILEELSEVYFERQTLATLIAMKPVPERKKKFKPYNNILLGLLVLTILLKILIGILVLPDISIYIIPFALILPLLTVFFAIEVSKYKAYIYKPLGLLAIVGTGGSLRNYESIDFWFMIQLSIGLLIVCLSFYTGKKMFPNYGLMGPKRDQNGNISLE